MDQKLDIARYFNALVRGWWIILLIAAIAGLVTYFVTPKPPPSFASSASLSIEDPIQQNNITVPFTTLPPAPSLANQAQDIVSPRVLRRAAIKLLGSEENTAAISREVQELQENISTRQLRNTNVVVITARALQPDQAVARANAVSEAYVEQVGEDQTTEITRRLESISRQIGALQDARNESYTVDPQSVALLEDQLSSVEVAIISVLDKLEALRQSGHAISLSTDTFSTMSDQLDVVANDLTKVQTQLQVIRDQKFQDSGSGAASQVTAGLISAADSLERGANQLEDTILEQTIAVTPQTSTATVRIEESIVEISGYLNQAASTLSEIPDDPQQQSPSLLASDTISTTANSMSSAGRSVDSVIRSPGAAVNTALLQDTRDQIAIIDSDLRRISSEARSLSDDVGGTADAQARQEIVEELQVLQTFIGTVTPNLGLLVFQETQPQNQLSLITAQTQVGQASTSINDAILTIQAIGQGTGTVVSTASLSDLHDQLINLDTELIELVNDVRDLAQTEPFNESDHLALIAEVTSLRTSLDTISLQIQARKATDPDKFVPLFITGERLSDALSTMAVLMSDLDALGGAPGLPPSLISLEDTREQMSFLASEFRLIVSEYGLVLARGSLNEEQHSVLSDQLSIQNASLELAVQQLQALRVSQTDVNVYGIIRTAEERSTDALADLTNVVSLVRQLGAASTGVSAAQLDDLQAKASEISNTIQITKLDIDDLLNRIEVDQEVDTEIVTSIGDRVVASSEILTTVLGNVSQIRAQETNVEAHSSLLAVERQLQISSATLNNSSSQIDQLIKRPSDEVGQSLGIAADEGLKARDTMNRILQRLDLLRQDLRADTSIAPNELVALSQEFRILGQSLEAASFELQNAQQLETLPTVLSEISTVANEADSAKIVVTDTAMQLEQLSQPSAAEASIYTQLLDSQRQLQLGQLLFNDQTIRIVSPPLVAQRVSDSSVMTNLAMGIIAGLLFGIVFILAQEYLDKRLRTPDDVRRQLEMPAFGAIPRARGAWNPHPQLTIDAPASLFSESLRMVRTAVEVSRQSRAAKILVVTSPRDGEGKTTVALNLARSMAMEQRKILIIDGNLRAPEIAEAFKIDSDEGLSNALRLGRDPSDYVQEVDGVFVLPAGKSEANPTDVLASPVFRRFLDQAKEEYDTIIIDSPPVVGFADSIVLAKSADGVILTYRADRTTAGFATRANNILRSAGVDILGAVLNMASRRATGVVFRNNYGNTGNRPIWKRILRRA